MKRMRAAAVAAFLLVLASCATPPSLEEIGENAYGAGGSLIVEMGTHLIVFDPPADERRSRSFLEATTRRFPGKQLRYLVLTRVAIEPPEALRAYLAQGREWIVRRGAAEGLRRALSSAHTRIVEISDRYVLADEEREVDIFPADGPGGLLGYVRHAKSGAVTELRER